jgi:hypothetical protein
MVGMERTQAHHLFAFFYKAKMLRYHVHNICSLLYPADYAVVELYRHVHSMPANIPLNLPTPLSHAHHSLKPVSRQSNATGLGQLAVEGSGH